MEQFRNHVLRGLVNIRESSRGQGFVEYLMITGLIGIALTAALIAFRGQISTALTNVGTGV